MIINMQKRSISPLIISLCFIICIILLPNPISTQQWYQTGNPHFIFQHDFQKLITNQQTRNKGVSILKFFTPWCRYCKFLKDIIQQLLAQGEWNIKIYQVNCDGPNYQFCGHMGVMSFPKMIIYENGEHRESMDGFYPYPVIKELFVKYNRTVEVKKEEPKPEIQAEQHKQEEHLVIQPEVIKPVEQTKKQQTNLNQPQGLKHQQNVPSPPVTPPQSHQNKNPEQQNPNKQSPSNNPPHLSPHQQSNLQTPQPKLPQQVKPTNQQMLQQKQNIAIMDQNIKQIQSQKKLVQEIQKQKLQSIDLAKHGEKLIQHVKNSSYAKYIMYAIIILIGGYYFMHIMKGEPDNGVSNNNKTQEPSRSYNQKRGNSLLQNNNINSNNNSNNKTIQQNKCGPISIQDCEMNEQLHFEHPNHEQYETNSCQDTEIKDEDL